MNESVECPWCKRVYVLDDDRQWPGHYRQLAVGEKRRKGQMNKRCEGSGAYCKAAEELIKS